MIKNNKHFIYFLLATFVLGNFHLFQLMTETYLHTNLLFLAWLFIFFLLTHVIFISLLNVIVPIRILFVLVVTLSLIFNFYLIKFGTVFDTGMWRNMDESPNKSLASFMLVWKILRHIPVSNTVPNFIK